LNSTGNCPWRVRSLLRNAYTADTRPLDSYGWVSCSSNFTPLPDAVVSTAPATNNLPPGLRAHRPGKLVCLTKIAEVADIVPALQFFETYHS
jgi:hypothetical protein